MSIAKPRQYSMQLSLPVRPSGRVVLCSPKCIIGDKYLWYVGAKGAKEIIGVVAHIRFPFICDLRKSDHPTYGAFTHFGRSLEHHKVMLLKHFPSLNRGVGRTTHGC